MVTTTNYQILLHAGLYVTCFMFDISIPFFLSKNPKREVLSPFQMEMWENWCSRSSKSLREWGPLAHMTVLMQLRSGFFWENMFLLVNWRGLIRAFESLLKRLDGMTKGAAGFTAEQEWGRPNAGQICTLIRSSISQHVVLWLLSSPAGLPITSGQLDSLGG